MACPKSSVGWDTIAVFPPFPGCECKRLTLSFVEQTPGAQEEVKVRSVPVSDLLSSLSKPCRKAEKEKERKSKEGVTRDNLRWETSLKMILVFSY